MTASRYEAALDYLFTATDYEKMRRVRYNADTFSLDRVERLLSALGDPHRGFRAVHVAGTKGKGSTAAMAAALARAAGWRVGLYTSPHLEDIRERIHVGGCRIRPEALARCVERVRPHVERMRAAGDAPTFFEIFTCMAFDHFVRRRVDLAVVEVGLGGRLDATNVLVPEVAVLTAVSLDHTAQLGRTLRAVAHEKAGIVKPGVPVIAQPQPSEAAAVIRAACRRAGARLLEVGRQVAYTWAPAVRRGRPGGRLSVRTPRAGYPDLFLPLMGEHQALNAAAALAAVEQVRGLAERLTPERVRRALGQLRWPGRMEYRRGRPALVLDGAHNRASLERLAEALARHFPGRPVAVVFGCAADKDVGGMLAVLAGRFDGAPVVFTRAEGPRAAGAGDLARRFREGGGTRGQARADPLEAIRRARATVGPDGLVVVCGSLYLVGEVRRRLGPAGAGDG